MTSKILINFPAVKDNNDFQNPLESYVSIEAKERLLGYLKDQVDLDFTEYSEASVRRRIAKMLRDLRLKNVDEFIDLLEHSPDAAAFFIERFTVNVTEMFRDPDFYVALRKDVLPIISSQGDFKIWSAGCSTGEEIVSLVILLKEAGLLERSEILATDISEAALLQAEQRVYKLRHLQNSADAYQAAGGKERLTDYFVVNGGEAKVRPELMLNVSYHKHNLSEEPVERNFDLILCRNVLIYFDPALQNKVLSLLNPALRSGGFLGLGSKESLIFYDNRDGFTEINEERLYQKN